MEPMKMEFCSEERNSQVADIPDVIGTGIRLDFMSIFTLIFIQRTYLRVDGDVLSFLFFLFFVEMIKFL